MYNKKSIIAGLAIFALILTFPVWYNLLIPGSDEPEVVLPTGVLNCVKPADEMRATHMKLLDEWRDDVLRHNGRMMVTVDGKEYKKGLQMACMECHTNKETFCDPCHDYASVKPYCWDCHLSPKEQAAK
ncbi:MAG: cytochrome C [Deltaproteobacteria bacterium]|nr:MAG: cytochrome C [Deltaproteobacteria bacterium]